MGTVKRCNLTIIFEVLKFKPSPLFHAVTESSLDVVRALAEGGGASVDISDDNNETAIDWA